MPTVYKTIRDACKLFKCNQYPDAGKCCYFCIYSGECTDRLGVCKNHPDKCNQYRIGMGYTVLDESEPLQEYDEDMEDCGDSQI